MGCSLSCAIHRQQLDEACSADGTSGHAWSWGLWREASHQVWGIWSPASNREVSAFCSWIGPAPHRNFSGSVIFFQKINTLSSQRVKLQPLSMGSPKRWFNISKLAPRDRRRAHIQHSSPQNQLWKELMCVKQWCQTRCQENPASQLTMQAEHSQQLSARHGNLRTPLFSETSQTNLNVYKMQMSHLFLFLIFLAIIWR